MIGERSITADLHPVHAVDGVAVGLALGPDGSYTDALARLARDGAQVVAVADARLGRLRRHAARAHLRVRAAEHRLAIVKSDWRYGSAIVAPDGASRRRDSGRHPAGDHAGGRRLGYDARNAV